MAQRRRRVVTALKDDPLRCSFCAKNQVEVEKLVAGPGVFICNECVALCHEIIADEALKAPPAERSPGDEPPKMKHWDGLSDDELLAEMVRAHAAHENVDRAVRGYVSDLRQRGVTWVRIGEALDMTRQSAWERFSGEE
jgi:hypothetical protein